MCSTAVLKERIDNMNEQNKKEHWEMLGWIKEIKKDLKDFIEASDEKYATKEEVGNIRDTIKSNTEVKNKKSIEWIRTWGIVIVAVISAISVLVPMFIK